MYTLVIILSAVGFFMLYNTSRKAKLSQAGGFEVWLQAHHKPAKITGLSLIFLSFLMLIIKDGVGAGILTAFLLLMLAGSLIVMIAPFHFFKLKHILFLVAGSLLLELLIF